MEAGRPLRRLLFWLSRRLREGVLRVETELDASRASFRSRVNNTFSLWISCGEIREKEESSMTPKFGA